MLTGTITVRPSSDICNDKLPVSSPYSAKSIREYLQEGIPALGLWSRRH